jgi:hypothetical protein
MADLTNEHADKLARVIELGKLSEEARLDVLDHIDQGNRIIALARDYARKSLEYKAEMLKLEEEMQNGG